MEYKIVTDDSRGVFAELLKLHCGQISYVEVAPGAKRGGHYHKRKSEVFVLLTGKCDLVLENGNCSSSVRMKAFERYIIPINDYHTLINDSKRKACILIYYDEIYNPEDKDTYSE